MATDSNNQIARTSEASAVNTGVEIYLNNDILGRLIEEYESLRQTFIQWAKCEGINEGQLADGTAGYTSDAFVVLYDKFQSEIFARMFTGLCCAKAAMTDAHGRANELLLRCEDFYEIILGGGSYYRSSISASNYNSYFLAGKPLTPVLYLNTTYYGSGSGTISLSTEDAVLQFKNISEEDEKLERLLNSLEIGKINITAECNSIQDNCARSSRLNALFSSFVEYIKGVNELNNQISEGLDGIVFQEFVLDNTRNYDYPYVKDEKESAFLNKVLRENLYEKGFTDKEIDNAQKNGNISLNELARFVEYMVVEDTIYNSDNASIELVKAVLNGDAATLSDSYNKYIDKIDNDEISCWIVISKYIMNTAELRKSVDGSILQRHIDGLYVFNNKNEFILQMNGIINADNRKKILNCLMNGAAINAYASCEDACLTDRKSDGYQYTYLKYVKDMEVHDSFSYFLGLVGKQDSTVDYRIDDVHFNNDEELVFSMTERDGVGNYNSFNEYPDRPWDREITMKVKYVSGPSDINDVQAMYSKEDELTKAIEEHDAQVANLIREGTGAVGFVLGGAPVKTVINTAYDLYDVMQGEADLETYNDYLGEYGVGAISDDAKDQYGEITKPIIATFKVLSDDSIEKAQKGVSDFIATKYTGSAGACEIKYSDEAEFHTKYVVLHANSVAPEYVNSFADIRNKSNIVREHGFSAMGNWDPEFKQEVINQLDKQGYEGYKDSQIKQIKEDCKQLIDGGYDVSKMRDPEKNGLVDDEFKIIQGAYNNAVSEEKVKEHIPEAGQGDHKSSINSLWGKQGTGSGNWLDERDEKEAASEGWWNEEG